MQETIKEFREGNLDATPNVQSFNTLMNAWAECGRVDAPAQCKTILNRMIDLSERGELGVAPDVVRYSIALKACTKSEDSARAKVVQEMRAAGRKQRK